MGDMGLATDGDGDRIGAMDERGNYIDPHKIMALAMRYLVEERGWRGPVVRSVSTTRMIDRLAQAHDLPVYETPVGFNYIADYMLKEDILIGGEESGGITFRGHIPEGDGSLMALLLIEIVATLGSSLYELVEDLITKYGPVHYQRTDLRLNHPISKEQMSRKLIEETPPEIGGEKVIEVQSLDGVKFILEDDSWLLIRPSGTEPVLRVYAEGRNPEMVQDLLKFGEEVAAGTT
jgi:phosphomannomutase